MIKTTKFKSNFKNYIEGTKKLDYETSSHYMGNMSTTYKGLKDVVFFDTESDSKFYISNKQVTREKYNKSKSKNKEQVFYIKTIQAVFCKYKYSRKLKTENWETNYKVYIIGESIFKDPDIYFTYTNQVTGEKVTVYSPCLYFNDAKSAIGQFYNDINSLKNPWIMCHNSKHDWMQIQLFKWHEYFNLELQSFNLVTPRFSLWENSDNKLTFVDTTNFFFSPLKKLGETAGVIKASDKVDFTKDLVVDDDLIYYGLLDVEILKVRFLNYSKQVKQYGKIKFGIAGTAYNIFLTSFLNDKIWIHKNPDLMKIERASYFGGRTECYKLGEYHNVYGIDINSSYPYQYSLDLPMSYICTCENTNGYIPHDLYFKWQETTCMLIEATITSNLELTIIPKRYNGKLIFINGKNLDCTLCQPEINKLIEMGADVKIKKVHKYKKGRPMKEFSDYFMKMKEEGKLKNDEEMTLFGKNNANSSYGKLAERKIESMILQSTGNIGYYTLINTKTGKEEQFKELGGLMIRSWKTENDAKDAYCIMGSYITSYARIHLYDAMYKIGRNNLVYSDTDSIYFILPDGQEINKFLNSRGIKTDSKKLGYWDVEEKNIKMITYGAKDYLKINQSSNELIKQKLKGVNLKNSMQINENTYYCERWQGFSYGIRQQDISHQHICIMEKVLTRVYNKAHIINPNTRKISSYVEKGKNKKVNFIQSEIRHFYFKGNNYIIEGK